MRNNDHPSATDLANLAREQLGRKKTQRILEHCKECPECAELLLEAVRSQPFERERVKLSKWNWISIIVLLVGVIGVFVLLLWLLRGAARPPTELTPADTGEFETVYEAQPDSWFEALFTRAIVAPSADTMLLIDAGGVRLIDLRDGSDLHERLWLDFDGILAATFDGNGAVARYANKRRDLGWFVVDEEEMRSTTLPPSAVPAWAPGNVDVAWTRPPANRIYLGYPPRQRAYDAGGRVLGLAWAPSGEEAYALVMDDDGSSSLVRARRATTRVEVVRTGLDASPLPNSLAVSPDGEGVFIALAGPSEPAGEMRHSPQADRDLDIYRVDVRSGDLQRVIDSPGDDFWPWVSNEALYWTHNEHRASVVVFPLGDRGVVTEPTAVLAGQEVDGADAQLPRWDPRGGQLAYTRGSWRLADWGLPFDVMVLAVDESGMAAGGPRPLITGYHQDLTPVWSPDGRWLAYRSRRADAPVPYYAGPGVADDIFLRPANDPATPELRVSESGWEVGGPTWLDDRRVLFDSWDRAGVPRVSRPWIAHLDPDTGEVLARERLPLPEGVTGSVSGVSSPGIDGLLLIERRDPETQTLWLVPPEERRARRLVDFESRTRGGADWMPGGESLVYAASVDGTMQLFSIGRDGGEPRRLTDADANLMHPSVSPDARWVAATRLVQQKEIRRIPLTGRR